MVDYFLRFFFVLLLFDFNKQSTLNVKISAPRELIRSELENLIERLVILKGGNVISASDLPVKFLQHKSIHSGFETLITLPDEGMDLKQALSDIEDSLIHQALDKTDGNKNQASKLLQMNRTTLIEKMKKKGMANQLTQ